MSVTSVFRPSDLPTGLQGYWKLDEASGTRADSSGKGNTLADNNTVGNAAFNYWDAIEASADFERGNSEYLSIVDGSQDPGLDIQSDLSISFWVKMESNNVQGVIARGQGSNSPVGYEISLSSSNPSNINFRAGSESGGSVAVTNILSVGKWHHVVCVADFGGLAQIYVDGNLAGTSDYSGRAAPTTSAQTFVIGSLHSIGSFFDGLIKDVAVWSRVLTPLEIKSLALGLDLSADVYRPSDVSTAPDAYWKLNEVSALADNDSRADSSGNGHTLTSASAGANPSTLGGYIEGATADYDGGDSLTAATDPVWAPLTGDYSVACWARFETFAATTNTLMAHGSSKWTLSVKNTGALTATIEGLSVGGSSATGLFKLNTWHHVAMVKKSGVYTFFLDGVAVYTIANAVNIPDISQVLYVGNVILLNRINGQMADAAYWKGYAVTPAEIASLAAGLPIQQTGLVSYWPLDESPGGQPVETLGNAKITETKFNNTAGFFDGVGDYVAVPDSADWDFGTGDFTIDYWVKITTTTQAMTICATGRTTGGFQLENQLGAQPTSWRLFLAGTLTTFTAVTTEVDRWYHHEVSRSSGTVKFFIDGVENHSAANAGNVTGSATALQIGNSPVDGQPLKGWLKEFRISDIARHTTGFTPETSQYASDGNTLLLMHFDTPAASPIGPSLWLDGNSDAIYLANADKGTAGDPGTGAFTMEGWFKWRNITAAQNLCDWGQGGTRGVRLQLNSGALRTTIMANNVFNHTFVPVLHQWYHLAIVRESTAANKTHFFVDGRLVASGTSADNITTASDDLVLGSAVGRTTSFFKGAIRQWRISNVARYTDATDFTPPQVDLGVDANTLFYAKLDEDNGATTFVDSETVPKTISVEDTAQIRYDTDYRSNIFVDDGNTGHFPYVGSGGPKVDFIAVFGSGSYVGDGVLNSLLEIPTTTDWDWDAEYTVEFFARWFNKADTSQRFVARTNGADGTAFSIFTDGTNFAVQHNVNVTVCTTTLTNINVDLQNDKWYHVMVTRDFGGTVRLFLNGYEIASGVNTTALGPFTKELSVGGRSYNAVNEGEINGQMDDLRISKGIARENGIFNPTAIPVVTDGNTVLLLDMNGEDAGTYFLDTSADKLRKQVTANGDAQIDTALTDAFGGNAGVLLCDGTGDYLSVPHSSDFEFGKGDFTVEFWLYLTSLGTNSFIYNGANTSLGDWHLDMNAGNSKLRWQGASGGAFENDTALATGQWYHIAYVRTNGVLTCYLDGVEDGTITDTRDYNDADFEGPDNLYIGANNTPVGTLSGYMDEVRLSRTARWTADFTVPSAAYTADDFDVLLLHMDGADAATTFIDDAGTVNAPVVRLDSIGNNDLTDVNNVGAVVGKVSRAGQFLIGDTNYLTIPDASQDPAGSLEPPRDFMVMAWFKKLANVGASGATILGKATGFSVGYALRIKSTEDLAINLGAVNADTVATTVLGQWHHCVGQYTGATLETYLDGVADGSVAHTTDYVDNATAFQIGATDGGRRITGVIDEVLIANRYFRPEEIKSVYNLGQTGQEATAEVAPVPPPPPTAPFNRGLFLAFPV